MKPAQMRRAFDPLPPEAVRAPWTVPQMAKLVAWLGKKPILSPRCPRQHEISPRPKLDVWWDGFRCPVHGCGFRQTWATPTPFRCSNVETQEEMQERVNGWNAKNEEGTSVRYETTGPNPVTMATFTKSRAYIDDSVGPAVHIDRINGAIPLDDLTPQKRRGKRKAKLEVRSEDSEQISYLGGATP